jgi:hypothetical protein
MNPCWHAKARACTCSGACCDRYRWPVAAAAALILALAAGLVGTLWQAQKAATQARVAEAQALRAEATKNFLLGVFKASDPRQASDKPRGGITARELLDASAPRIERDFAAQPELQIELLGTIAEIFHELFESERYAALHARYMELARQRYGEQDPRVIDGYLQEAKDASDFESATRLLDRVDPLIRQAGLDRSPVRARWWVLKAEHHQLGHEAAGRIRIHAATCDRVVREHQSRGPAVSQCAALSGQRLQRRSRRCRARARISSPRQIRSGFAAGTQRRASGTHRIQSCHRVGRVG